ncbi:MAG: hypothetical protein OXC65_05795 [Thiotrichales bacterium]|nr:hypothetical protein [Thiotrichales bacterium]
MWDAVRHGDDYRQNRDVAVVVSSTDCQRLMRSDVEEFQRFCNRISETVKMCGMTEETLDKVLLGQD